MFASPKRYFTENSRWVPLNNALRWSAKDINKIKLPLSKTGGKCGYIITLIRICKPKWRKNTSDKVKVRFVTCYFRLVGGKLTRDWFNYWSAVANVPGSEHRRIAIACRNLYANIRHSTHSTWMNHSIWYSLSPAFTETNENFWAICVDNQRQASR